MQHGHTDTTRSGARRRVAPCHREWNTFGAGDHQNAGDRCSPRLGQPQKRDVFLGILAERDEPPRFKNMAVMGLYELGGDEAREALRVAARVASAADRGHGRARFGQNWLTSRRRPDR